MCGPAGRSGLRLRGREFAGDDGVRKSAGFVGAVTEGLVGGMAATAESYGGPAGEAKDLALRVDDLEVAFDAK